MRIIDIQDDPTHHLSYWSARARGGAELSHLPIYEARLESLPEGLEAIVFFSDLQGREVDSATSQPGRLLGVALAEELELLSMLGRLPSLERVGVINAGDLYAAPSADQRGASGDVSAVWRAFSERMRWIVGVPGNHDLFDADRLSAGHAEVTSERCSASLRVLDGDVWEVDQLRFAGVAGIAGRSGKPWRMSTQNRAELISRLLAQKIDCLILHECGGANDLAVEDMLSHVKRRTSNRHLKRPLIIYGHHQVTPMLHMIGDHQALNVDGRVIIAR